MDSSNVHFFQDCQKCVQVKRLHNVTNELTKLLFERECQRPFRHAEAVVYQLLGF